MGGHGLDDLQLKKKNTHTQRERELNASLEMCLNLGLVVVGVVEEVAVVVAFGEIVVVVLEIWIAGPCTDAAGR